MEEAYIHPLLTDSYQISMAYAYWKSGKINDTAVFDLFFRKNPFKGEYTIFAGLENCIKLIQKFRYTENDIAYLRSIMPPEVDSAFFDYLEHLNADQVTLTSIPEGSVVFPKVPLIIVEGPLIICQLLETGLLNLINFASLVATNATRYRQAVGDNKQLLEFGLRRAQGPDGGMCASRNCFLGGFDATSNVLAGMLYGIPVKGTHAHAYITSFEKLTDLKSTTLKPANKKAEVDFVDLCRKWHSRATDVLGVLSDQTAEGELAAFISYALAFPTRFLCLVDTFDVIRSGIPNFISVSLALHECGYNAIGVRIDSGDLAYLSNEIRERFRLISVKFNIPWFHSLTIVASNDINEETLHSLNQQVLLSHRFYGATHILLLPSVVSFRGRYAEDQGHSIDSFGIGTHLVTCQKQPALGCVYKLVEVNGRASLKLSEDLDKMNIPGKKNMYRLFGKDKLALTDYMTRCDESPPTVNERLLCRHPSDATKRAYVIPSCVDVIHRVYWSHGKQVTAFPSLVEMKQQAKLSLQSIRSDHKRALNPTPYKVSISSSLYSFTQEMWLKSAPIGELC